MTKEKYLEIQLLFDCVQYSESGQRKVTKYRNRTTSHIWNNFSDDALSSFLYSLIFPLTAFHENPITYSNDDGGGDGGANGGYSGRWRGVVERCGGEVWWKVVV